MKTTLEIADPLLQQARELAARDGETLRSLVEQGLRKVVAERQSRVRPFKLHDASVGGKGLTPEFEAASPEQWHKAIYGDRGG